MPCSQRKKTNVIIVTRTAVMLFCRPSPSFNGNAIPGLAEPGSRVAPPLDVDDEEDDASVWTLRNHELNCKPSKNLALSTRSH
jgi:hypothetical protein